MCATLQCRHNTPSNTFGSGHVYHHAAMLHAERGRGPDGSGRPHRIKARWRKRMKAVVYTAYGPPDVLHLTEVATPTPTDDDVLIKVQAVSVNRSDWEGLTGKPLYARFGGLLKPGPQILGSDIAGRVVMAGRNQAQFQPGDEVFGEMWDYHGWFCRVCLYSWKSLGAQTSQSDLRASSGHPASRSDRPAGDS